MYDDEYPDFIRRLRERARRDADELVPRPGHPIYGLAAPPLTPAAVSETNRSNGRWTSITLTYGRSADAPDGPCVTVTTAAVDPGPGGMLIQRRAQGVEAELRLAVQRGSGGDCRDEPAAGGRKTLPFGEVLMVRRGTEWAARLLASEPSVVVTVVGRDVSPESVRLEQLASLRPIIEAHSAEVIGRIQRNRAVPRPPAPPLPDLPLATGVAALRALADYTLATHAEIRASVASGRPPEHGPARAGMHRALWQRATAERRRLAGEDERTAEQVVTSAVNHLGHLAEHAPWFTADERLREAAIDETLRHAMLDERVPSERAQYLWARYWAERASLSRRVDFEPGEHARRLFANYERFEGDLNAAWEAWAANA